MRAVGKIWVMRAGSGGPSFRHVPVSGEVEGVVVRSFESEEPLSAYEVRVAKEILRAKACADSIGKGAENV